jgi:hypothetical protein
MFHLISQIKNPALKKGRGVTKQKPEKALL